MPNHSSLNDGIFNIKKLSNSVHEFFCLKIRFLNINYVLFLDEKNPKSRL
jgi:hypothetical protein